MFFREFNDIQSSIHHLNEVLIPEIRKEIGSLNSNIQANPSEDACQLQFFILVTNFEQEFEKLIRLLNMVFLPAFSAHEGKQTQFNEFKVLRAAHKRLYRILGNLRNICNEYVMEGNWSDCKKMNCLNSHQLELKFLNYFNFTESTIIPLIECASTVEPNNSYDTVKND